MLLKEERSLFEKKQSIVVSRDRGTAREHRAVNPDRRYSLRHYKMDGDLIKQKKCGGRLKYSTGTMIEKLD